MSINPNQNGVLPVKQNDMIFFEGQDVHSVNLLINGRADVFISCQESSDGKSESDVLRESYRVFDIGQNTFIGACDLLLSGKYAFSCRASEDSTVYAFAVRNEEQLKALLNSNKDYGAYIAASISILISRSHSALARLEEFAKSLGILANNLTVLFWILRANQGFSHSPSDRLFTEGLDSLQRMTEVGFSLPTSFSSTFLEQDNSEFFETDSSCAGDIKESRVEYHKHFLSIPPELCKSFFAADTYITEYHLKDAAECLYELQSGIKSALKAANTYIKSIYNQDEECILEEFFKAALESMKAGDNAEDLLKTIRYTIMRIKDAAERFDREYLHPLDIDMKYLDETYRQIETNVSAYVKVSQAFSEEGGMEEMIPEELRHSARKIVEYSEIPQQRAEAFLKNLKAFSKFKGRYIQDSEARSLVNAISSEFFEIYGNVLKKVTEQNNTSRLYNMFLTYGYMDERLLSPNHVMELYMLAGRNDTGNRNSVYNIKDWLTMVYKMEKEPSINEFGQDYYDVFREMKKRGEVSDKDKQNYDNDRDGRLRHEISNMFRINQKVCHGQINSYFPILNDEMISRDLSKALVTPDAVGECINKILEVDFSAFHREISYRNPEKGIEKEFIMKYSPPDIILMPIYGCRAVMWQELTGRDRSTPGRFILPVFTSENLGELLIKLVGNFRWELCRTMMGVSWNDISLSSLTSDYTDYIQFYKKNKDLSEEAKEKVALQIQKHRNMMKDIFTSDYETWINHESKGILRLNKVARTILFKHCPFSRPIREQLQKQPIYSDLIMQFKNNRHKLVKSLESRYNRYTKNGAPLDPDLEQNLRFYRDM